MPIESMDANAALAATLRSLGEEFKGNDLAYALLESKNEQLLCNALASRLGAMLAGAPRLRVVREWGRGVQGLGRKRIDLAVLNGDCPIALVEAKVAMSFDLVVDTDRRYPSKEVREDIAKLQGVESDGERYALLFVTHNHEAPCDEFRESIPYFSGMQTHAPIVGDRIDGGFERFREAVGKLPVVASGAIPAGYAFGTEVSVFYWLLAGD